MRYPENHHLLFAKNRGNMFAETFNYVFILVWDIGYDFRKVTSRNNVKMWKNWKIQGKKHSFLEAKPKESVKRFTVNCTLRKSFIFPFFLKCWCSSVFRVFKSFKWFWYFGQTIFFCETNLDIYIYIHVYIYMYIYIVFFLRF